MTQQPVKQILNLGKYNPFEHRFDEYRPNTDDMDLNTIGMSS